MSNLKYSDTARSFLFGLADLISRYDSVDIYYTTDDDGIHIDINSEEILIGFNPTPIKLHKIANSV